ncbi:hypothetical protein [Streptomyces sp. SPB074]|uniref:hypothetical protein n=1 Tax=Streptomyces sp. (strain SPB074) TaxID=465543 RepID=UPI00017F12B0|nr:hypothetical protein [Streptomyces sp. SPB074]EFG64437.1 conserved hypothetical protein [Streptomyces sp. SPB074]
MNRSPLPRPARRLAAQQLALWRGFLRWAGRRGPDGVGAGDLAAPYAPAQAATMYGLLFVAAAETVALAVVIPWPWVHTAVLVIDLWGCWYVLALHASCVVRPHVLRADGSLRLRYGPLLDVTLPASRIAVVRADRAFPEARPGAVDASGRADLPVGGMTTLTVELTEPLTYARPLGAPAAARVFRVHAENAAEVARAWRGIREASRPARE